MKVSIVIPVYNERERILDSLRQVREAPFPPEKEIIIVDDGSRDGTADILRGLSDPSFTVVLTPRNKGKGAALRAGFARATGDIVVVQDADLEYSPEDYPRLLKPLMEGYADAVFGSRFTGGDAHRVHLFWHYAANRFLTLLSNMATNLNLTDMEVGYKAFKRDILERVTLREDRFGFEPEITAKLARLKCRIYEVPVSYYGRNYTEGKKITWRDAVSALRCIIKYGLLRA